jgi:acylphosphatase
MSTEEKIEIKAVVHGKVQGVGFRATVRHHAKRLGIVGTARNLPDGRVEICAYGPKNDLDRLFAILRDEEFPGHITEIIVEKAPLQGSKDSFNIVS